MTYQQARRIRNKDYSLANLITRNIRSKDMSAGQSIKEAFKEKFDIKTRLKAKVTGIKEKFDPLNIAKFLTGGSNFAPALLGKLTGRSKADIRNFTGGRQSYEDFGAPTATKIGRDPHAGGGGDQTGMIDMLNKILELQQRTYDNIKEQRERLSNFKEEKELEADKRHKALLDAIKGFTPREQKQTAEKVKEESPSFSLADLLGGATLASRLLNVLKWFGGPVGMALLGAASIVALIMLIAAGLKKLADNTPNMKALSPNEAQAILQNGSEKDIEKAGGRAALEETIKNGRKNAMDTMNMSENTDEEKEIKRRKILELGGKDKLEQIIKDEKIYEIPAAGSGQSMADKLPFTKQQFIGTGLAAKSKEGKWNKEYAPYYNDDGTKKIATPASTEAAAPTSTETATPAPTSPAAAAPATTPTATPTSPATPAPKVPAAPAAPTAAPVTTTPTSQQLNTATSENRTAKIDSMVAPSTTTTNNVVAKNPSKKMQPKEGIPAVRNMEATLQRMIYNSTRVV